MADEEALAWIPGRLLVQGSVDSSFQMFLFNGPLREGLLPPKTSDAAAARHWAAIYQAPAPTSTAVHPPFLLLECTLTG